MKEWHTLMASYERLFYKVLIRAGIFPSHPDFEDYLQELRLMLFERARRYPDEGIFRNENEVNYLFGFLLWRVIDLQRKSNRQKQLIQAITSEQEETIDLKDYDVVFLGYPLWWDLCPRPVNTFLEKYDFAGKTVIPFATSGGSSITGSVKQLKKLYPKIEWEEGRLFNSGTANVAGWSKQIIEKL